MHLSIDVLRGCSLFATLKDEELSLIFNKLEKIELKEEEILFRENDVDGSLFVLVSGRLEVFTETKNEQRLIGLIRPGEIVGELSLLSDEPRSASIKANTQSVLLRLKKSDFQSLCADHPNLLWNISCIIAARCQFNIRNTEAHKAQIIAFVSIDDSSLLRELATEMEKHDLSKMKVNIVDLSSQENKKNVYNSFNYAVSKRHIALFFIRYGDLIRNKELLEITDKIIFVLKEKSENRFQIEKETFAKIKHLNKELLLIHEKKAPWYPNTRRYLDFLQVSKCYHVSFDAPQTTLRVLRLLSGTGVGLVLSGGGARGWAIAGALKSFYEQDIHLDYVGGTSIGALCAALYSSCKNVEEFDQQVNSLTPPFSLRSLTFPIYSLFTGKKETTKAQELFNGIMIEDLSLPLFAISTNLSLYEESVWEKGPLWQAVRASGSVPLLFPPIIYNGQIHVDGGVMNNFPTDIMRTKLGHQGTIIGIDVGSFSQDLHSYSLPPAVTSLTVLKSFLKISNQPFDCIGIIEIILRTMSASYAMRYPQSYRNVDLLIKPSIKKFKFSDFDKSDELYLKGYREGVKQLKKWKK